jgi:methionine biosynthesis protein MetW
MNRQNHFSYDEIAELVEPGSSVLDLGCGRGLLLEKLIQERKVSGRGVDIEEEMIFECISKGISVFQGDLDEGLRDYGSASYDYVILNSTLQVVHNPLFLLSEMLRVGKKAIINFPNFGHLYNRIQLACTGQMPKTASLPYEWYNTPNIHLCTRKDFIRLCTREHISILKIIDMKNGRRISSFLSNVRATEVCFLLLGT